MHDSDSSQETEHVSFGAPTEVREFPNGRVELVSIGTSNYARSHR